MTAPERMPDERLADWVDGRMNDREQERFRAELRVNAQLRADLAAYEATVAAVRAALQAPTRPAALADRVLAAVAAKGATAPTSAPAPRRWYWAVLPAAAVLALAFLVDAWQPAAGAPDAATPVAAAGRPTDAAPIVAAPSVGDEADRALQRELTDTGAIASTGTSAPPVASPVVGGAQPGRPTGLAPAGERAAAPGAPAPAVGPTPLLELEVAATPATGVPRRAEGTGGLRGQTADDKAKVAPLAAADLRAALAEFLATAADPATAPAAMSWSTAHGELAASPWLDAPGTGTAATTRVWIVDGPKADVAELLAAAAAFARARGGVVRNGETTAPAGPSPAAPAAGAPSAHLVLRLQLRPR